MGVYLNPKNDKFLIALNSPVYVDKSELISYTNSVIATEFRYVCVSRPRRFGKSMAANMLTAYYSRGCDSKEIFQNLLIADNPAFETYLNRYDVIALNMQEFLSRTHDIKSMLARLVQMVTRDLQREYPQVTFYDLEDVIMCMQDVYEETGQTFVIIIDEWDCVLREYRHAVEEQKLYLDFLRDFLKDKGYIHLVYMTGILPIKKYGTHSALNMFNEFSMLHAGPLGRFTGFTETEVKNLCEKYQVDFEEVKDWYDGYRVMGTEGVYNPKSVVSCIQFKSFDNYWSQTETYEALKIYIDMNFDGLRDDILAMMEGESVSINTGSFTNDMTTFASKDDVMTLLVHLGYLGYNFERQQVFIPNHEILNEFVNAVRNSDWGEVSRALVLSQNMLKAIWDKQEYAVAEMMQESHLETSHLTYNDENALSYTISLALYAARNYYTIIREFPTGEGYADLVYLPKQRYADIPALLVELKWNQSAEGAIAQIKQKKYTTAFDGYTGRLLLVGINYDKKSRKHECRIEEITLPV